MHYIFFHFFIFKFTQRIINLLQQFRVGKIIFSFIDFIFNQVLRKTFENKEKKQGKESPASFSVLNRSSIG